MNNIKVSIIIPTYNVEQYLRECMASITNQTLKDIEIICVNDGSTDNSLEILNEYAAKDERVVVLSGPNGGYGKAMNKGLDYAHGEYIGIVEPDDFVSLDMYELLYNKAKEKDLDFVKADFYRFEEQANRNISYMYNNLSADETYYNRVINPAEEQYVFKFILNTWSGIYKRSFIEEYKIRHNETPGASFQDNGFYFQTFCFAKRAYFMDIPLYRNRRDNPNSSVKNKEKVYCVNEEYKYIRKILEDKNVWETFKNIFWFKCYQNYIFTLCRIDESFKRQYVDDISAELKSALANNEIDKTLFTEMDLKKFDMLVKNKEKFKELYLDNNQMRAETTAEKLHRIENSYSYKIGLIVTYIPRKILELFGIVIYCL